MGLFNEALANPMAKPRYSIKRDLLLFDDRLFIPLASPITAQFVAHAFSKNVIKHHGIPRSIISDRDRIFLSKVWTEVFKIQGTHLKHSTAFHPQRDGQTEVVNRCLQQYLKCFMMSKKSQWAHFIHLAEFWYNSSFHSAIGMSPFEATFGRQPPPLFYDQDFTPSLKDVADYRDTH